MAGPEQKSFLGNLSPWSTPRSATPLSSDRPAGSNPDVLQRSQGEDHTVTHRHKVSSRYYPSDCPPLKARWYYAVDSPKRKLAIPDQKKSEQKPPPPPKKFVQFSRSDSQAIEATFQKLSEIEDSHTSEAARKAALQQVSTKVPVNEDYLFDVDVEARELSPAYWIGPVYEVRRGTWFLQEGSSFKPCEENLATQLEEGYVKLRPWRLVTEDGGADKSDSSSSADVRSRANTGSDTQSTASEPSRPTKPRDKPQTGASGSATTAPTDIKQYRLFGAYMNRIVTYEDATTAWLTTDDFMSRVSTTVFQTLGGARGMKYVRGLGETRRSREVAADMKAPQRKQDGKASSTPQGEVTTTSSDAIPKPTSTSMEASGSDGELEAELHRPISTLERQMSSLAGQPQNQAELEEQARRQEEQEMEDSREIESEDQGREIDHLVLVTHGIGQRLGLRLESINFIHDVNVLRKTFKAVYKASPDLQALNSAFPDHMSNCRVQVIPVCWRHLLDFPYRGVRQNRKELDLTDADTLDDDAYPSLADITLESVPAVRNLISDLAMDVLLYQSAYADHIANIVKQECNRILELYQQRNPSFKGSVSLCGHSLGSAILFDILCHQSSDAGNTGTRGRAAPMGSADLADQRGGTDTRLNFDCEEFFCLGSPIALFQMLKGKTIAGHSGVEVRGRHGGMDTGDLESHRMGDLGASSRDSKSSRNLIENSAIISAPRCRDLYNIFHPSDPVSYRLEPLITPAMASLKPQPLPSVKKSIWATSGQSLSILGSRMGQSVGSLWSNFTSGVASSLLNRSLGLSAEESTPRGVSSSRPAADGVTGPTRSQSSLSQHTSSHGSDDHNETLIEHNLETLYDGFQKSRTQQKKDPARPAGGKANDVNAEDQERKMKFEDAKVRALNSNGRVDYSIQEGAFDISLIASIASHLTYWGDEDVNHFMLSQMLSRKSRHRLKGVPASDKTKA
ncbi:DDHD domain-containing protein [Penicillium ucsense]|uniref:DDHD domain-containing protein n=1 Tax=Penicillium ucsense TaxID=2839758 RepID=A0A8J8WF29_9EURO|nr:DDHD domain-containing protein [Penicillium ucsense]KAF7732233.1 DDHD domain-containing protein [Penicillium ucsense]